MLLSVGDLVRSMNCYYSNLIEDHNTTLSRAAVIALQNFVDHGINTYIFCS